MAINITNILNAITAKNNNADSTYSNFELSQINRAVNTINSENGVITYKSVSDLPSGDSVNAGQIAFIASPYSYDSGDSTLSRTGSFYYYNGDSWGVATLASDTAANTAASDFDISGDSALLTYVDADLETDTTVTDIAASGRTWATGVSTTTVDGVTCWDLESTYWEMSGTSGTLATDHYYTQFYVWKPRASDSGWRTLYRNSLHHLVIVNNGYKDLGVYENSPGTNSFHNSGYDIVVQWQVLIVVSNGSSGTTKFYVDGTEVGSVSGSVTDFGGTTLYRLGYSGQPPGKINTAGIFNRALTVAEVGQLNTTLQKKIA